VRFPSWLLSVLRDSRPTREKRLPVESELIQLLSPSRMEGVEIRGAGSRAERWSHDAVKSRFPVT
jgi:hypothetical protein